MLPACVEIRLATKHRARAGGNTLADEEEYDADDEDAEVDGL